MSDPVQESSPVAIHMNEYDLKIQSDTIPLKKSDGNRTVRITVKSVMGR